MPDGLHETPRTTPRASSGASGPRHSGLQLADQALAALAAGELATAAARAGEAADAFLAEQGEPSFDAPNMLRVRAEALLDAR